MTPTQPHPGAAHGTVLIVVMVVVFALAALVVTLGRHVRAEAYASANAVSIRSADAAARGAEQFVLALLTDYRDDVFTIDERDFAAVPVGDGFFWIVRPPSDDPREPLFGLVDENSKLDLNQASFESLRALPGMTDELAASIVDWRDGDDTPTESGAESTVYLGQSPAYAAKNGRFETVEELLLVHGMTADLLYGLPQRGARAASVDRYVTDGLFDQFTVWTRQSNTSPAGRRKVNITDDNRDGLRALLRDRLGNDRAEEVLEAVGRGRLVDVFDLANRGKLTSDEVAAIEGYVSSSGGRNVRGRVNVNAASRDVLRCLDGIDPGDADTLYDRRPEPQDGDAASVAWVWDALGERAVGLGNQITGRGQTFSADIVAVSGDGRAFRRVRMVVDASRTTPRVVYRRDITGRGWPLDPEVRAALRRGERDAVAALNSGGLSGFSR